MPCKRRKGFRYAVAEEVIPTPVVELPRPVLVHKKRRKKVIPPPLSGTKKIRTEMLRVKNKIQSSIDNLVGEQEPFSQGRLKKIVVLLAGLLVVSTVVAGSKSFQGKTAHGPSWTVHGPASKSIALGGRGRIGIKDLETGSSTSLIDKL